jgi:hypothetical protein
MDNRRMVQWLVPLLHGIAVGIILTWSLVLWLPGGGNALSKYAPIFALVAMFAALLIKSRTGYNWPWEGPAEWAQAPRTSAKTWLVNFALWVGIVFLLLALFTLWQFPGFK